MSEKAIMQYGENIIYKNKLSIIKDIVKDNNIIINVTLSSDKNSFKHRHVVKLFCKGKSKSFYDIDNIIYDSENNSILRGEDINYFSVLEFLAHQAVASQYSYQEYCAEFNLNDLSSKDDYKKYKKIGKDVIKLIGLELSYDIHLASIV